MAVLGAGIGISSFPSSSSSYLNHNSTRVASSLSNFSTLSLKNVSGWLASNPCVVCSALQETSTSAVTAESKDQKMQALDGDEAKEAEKPAAAKQKPKPPAKAAAIAKSLPQLMEDEVIPALKAILETQADISELELSFKDNRLDGSFLKKGIPYAFWAFFPTGSLTGPKGFSLSSYGNGSSTVEPFLVDEKKITGKHVVFWVEKRLAAQGIIPVWKE
ncbi:uncharacterized protein [Rutidosis leptorrhynchoides]|uniref:uncharacterized protein n=1 Tax=Rutidosis leptorrhynchoides TaxID=125765 RepID=UPI003A9944A2